MASKYQKNVFVLRNCFSVNDVSGIFITDICLQIMLLVRFSFCFSSFEYHLDSSFARNSCTLNDFIYYYNSYMFIEDLEELQELQKLQRDVCMKNIG